MKNFFLNIFGILSKFWSSSQGQSIIETVLDSINNEESNDMKVYTLHFGVNEYSTAPPKQGYGRVIQQLQSCHHDALDMSRLFGSIGDVFVNHEATSTRFVDKIMEVANKAKSGDFVLINMSSHGTHHRDESGDESDKEDEGTCFYDRVMWDDEIKKHLSNFVEGVNLLTIWDTCHSGTATRVFEQLPTGFLQKDAMLTHNEVKFFWSNANRYESTIKCNHLHIGASLDREFSLDGVDNGNFTGTFLNVIERRSTIGLSITLQDIMTEVKGVITRQHPNIDIVTKGGESILEMKMPFVNLKRHEEGLS